jgi:hypothetical protein|tara:strand:+ start:322 stop:645 length:324 start_codon:yes stop_codon:yes gene_type:complete
MEREAGEWSSRCESAVAARRSAEARYDALKQQLNDRTADVRLLRQQLANSEEQLASTSSSSRTKTSSFVKSAATAVEEEGGFEAIDTLPRASRALDIVKARQRARRR